VANAEVRAVLPGSAVVGVSTGLTFAVVLAVQAEHSIASAGVVAAVMTIADAALIPVRGRLVDRRGQGVLLPLSVVHGALLVGLAVGAQAAERIGAFTDRRVFRYWTLVGIVNGWPQSPVPDDAVDAWECYMKALRAHAS